MCEPSCEVEIVSRRAYDRVTALRKKLAAAEALLARRPHLALTGGCDNSTAYVPEVCDDPEECASLGGACAK